MEIAIGADVIGKNGKLGTVHRVIVDARSNTVTDLVVRHGFPFKQERIVPLAAVTKTDADGIHVDLDERQFEELEGFVEQNFRTPDPDYVGPPGFNNTEFLLDEVTAGVGLLGGEVVPPLGFPGGEPITPADTSRPVVEPGTPIVDVEGETVGEVHEFAANAETGAPEKLVLRRGLLFHHDMELPLAWIAQISDKGVTLSVTRREVEAWIEDMQRKEEHSAR
jgi:uncharacterized protein YrrD